jgi:hypothetical protein
LARQIDDDTSVAIPPGSLSIFVEGGAEFRYLRGFYDPAAMRKMVEEWFPGRTKSHTVPPPNGKNVRLAKGFHESRIMFNERGSPIFGSVLRVCWS